jgi:colicin import membrane protein
MEETMKRVIIIIVVLASLGIGGYFVVQTQNANAERAAAEAAAAVAAAEAAAAEAAAAAAADAAAAEAAAAQAAAAEAAIAEAAAAAAAAAEAAAAEAAAAVTSAAQDAAAGLADQAVQAQDALSALFTVDGFDFDAAIAALAAADIPALARTAVTTALGAARDNPELLPTALEQARNLLGLGQ